jgi:hypothetical protein
VVRPTERGRFVDGEAVVAHLDFDFGPGAGLQGVVDAEGNGGVVRIGVDGPAGAFDDFGQRHGVLLGS